VSKYRQRELILIRAFIGIDFDDNCKKYIYELQQKLKESARTGRWKYIDNFHLTLKFLDNITPEQKKQIDNIMQNICLEQNPFTLEISKLGFFSGNDTIRVLWLGLSGDLRQLGHLASKISYSLSEIGFAPEKRKYTPHITIGQDILFKYPFEQVNNSIGPIRFGPIAVNRLTLFKSEQIQGHRVYTKISEYPLKSKLQNI